MSGTRRFIVRHPGTGKTLAEGARLRSGHIVLLLADAYSADEGPPTGRPLPLMYGPEGEGVLARMWPGVTPEWLDAEGE